MNPSSSSADAANSPTYTSAKRKVEVRSSRKRMSARRMQAVSGAAHRVQKRLREALVDLLPETADMHVDHVGLRVEMVVPDILQQHRARDDMARVAHQVFEQPELARLQLDCLAVTGDGAGE